MSESAAASDKVPSGVSAPAAPMIEVSDLTRRYGGLQALSGVSFQIRRGEIVGFLGPNGAGKSTALKVMTCYLSPTSGSVRIAGLDVQDHPMEVREKFGYLPESAPLYLDMTAYDYLQYVGGLRGLSGADLKRRVVAVSQKVGITHVLGQVTGTLSKGYRQRVCLAQALIHDPEILILDEPTVGLDPNQVVEIRSLIKELGKERTVILSTHILPEVLATCDRILIIHKGRIVADGSPLALQMELAENPPVLARYKAQSSESDPQVLVGAVKSLALDLDATSRVVRREVPEPDEVELEIVTVQGVDPRPALLKQPELRGYGLLEVRRDLLDIEGLFRKLTQE